MVRNIVLSVAILCVAGTIQAQNLQLHFDPRNSLYGDKVGAPVNYLTATFEMFKPDQWGSTFMFVDFDFNFDKRNPGLAYAEIAREFKIGDFPLLPHIEYNGGLGLVREKNFGFSIPSSYLGGFGYPFQLGNFFMSTYVAYKLNAFQEVSHDAQWTITWNSSLAGGKLSLGGFFDLWSENKDRTGVESGKKLILLSEPQIWYNVTSQFALGSEIELSYNFAGADKFYAIPTIATKWNF
ncbi:DUF5020 family protein [uncultured Proteiniphilum sp.]|uniref:DUF5020 family protein n=1 Tax=uncultured Proteiniphilum sp. TaxID=497637 RepID=UPI00263977EE|nr:DUF5020 family protein [uncultured Proteiniphilum sp.]